MDRPDLLTLCLAIDRYFCLHGMRDHHRLLRAFMRELRGHERGPLRERDVPWDEEMVLRWARILGLRDGYPRQAGPSCPSCGVANDARTEWTFPDGWVLLCRCGARWVVEAIGHP